MRTVAHNVTFEQIVALAEKGLGGVEAAERLGISYMQISHCLKKQGVTYRNIQKGKSPHLKAWDTRKTQKALESYRKANSPGVRASISKKFKKEFGKDLKTLSIDVTPPKVKKVATTKESFKQKVEDLFIPYPVKQLIDGLASRIEFLEQQLMKK